MSRNLVLRTFIYLVVSTLVFISCKKTADIVPAPTVSFSSTDKGDGNYQFNINSTNATSYMWDFGDNEFSDEASPLHFYMSNGTYTVKVTAKGEGGSTSFTTTVNVRSRLGLVTFWTKTGNYTIDVTLEGKTASITSNYKSTPSCESSGTATFTGLKEGTHTFTAREIRTNPKTWSSTVIIRGGSCSKMELAY